MYDTYSLVSFPKDRELFVRVSSDARPFNDRVVHRFRKVHKAVCNPMEICSSHQYVGIFLEFVPGRVARVFKAKRKTEQCSVFLI